MVDVCFIVECMIGVDLFFVGLCYVGNVIEFCVEMLVVVLFDDISVVVLLGDVGKLYFFVDWYDWIEIFCVYDCDWFIFVVDVLVDG